MSAPSSFYSSAIKILAVVLLIIIFSVLGVMKPVEKITGKIFAYSAIIIRQQFLKINTFINKFNAGDDAGNGQNECTQNWQNERARAALLEGENNNLRAQINFTKEKKLKTQPANVVGEVQEKGLRALIINKGENDGLTPDLPVITQNGILIGKIFRVHETTSIVLLLNDNGSRVAAMVLNSERTSGLIEGGRGLSVKMNLIPQIETMATGDIVITSGLETLIPRGLIIGTIDSLQSDTRSPFQSATIKPAVNYKKENLVSVILPNE